MKKLLVHPTSEWQQWDDYVAAHPDGTIFHQSRWLKLQPGDLEIWVQTDANENILAGIPLLKAKRKRITGYFIPPYTPYNGPLFGNPQDPKHYNSTSKMLEFKQQLFQKIPKSSVIDFKLTSGIRNVLPYKWHGFEEQVAVTHIFEGSKEELPKKLHKNKLREIHKVEQLLESGELIFETQPEVQRILDLQLETAKRQGFNAHKSSLNSVLKQYDHSFMHSFAVRNQQQDLSVVFLVYDNKRVYNLVNASTNQSSQSKTANLYTLYQAISFALEKNLIFDFEGSSIPGVEQFYRLMGGVQQPVYRFTKWSSHWLGLLAYATRRFK